MAAFCSELREDKERLLTISTIRVTGASHSLHVILRKSSAADRLEAVQRANELQQGAQSHKVKHKHTQMDGKLMLLM